MVRGYLYYQSNRLSKLKYELNLSQTPSRAHARTRMNTLAFLHDNMKLLHSRYLWRVCLDLPYSIVFCVYDFS
jgi:hypothetical protein